MKPSAAIELITHSVKNNFSVMLEGSPGIGKTAIMYQVAEALGVDMMISHPVLDSPIDYKGLPSVADGVAKFLPYSHLDRAINTEDKLIWFLDDVGQAPPAVQAALMQVLWGGVINGKTISEHVTFVAATNRKTDKAGVTGILEPVKSRFRTIVLLEPDLDDWCQWALLNGMPTDLVAFIRFRPQFLLEFEPTTDMTNSASPRTIANVGSWVNSGVKKSLELEVFRGAAGEKFATEYMGFRRIFHELPSPDYVLTNPEKYDVPREPSTLYALAGALAARADVGNVERFLKAVGRMPKEFEVASVRDAAVSNNKLATTRGYIEWYSTNGDVLH